MRKKTRTASIGSPNSLFWITGMLFTAGLAIWAAMPVAAASDLPFAGTWATNPAECEVPQDLAGAPMILTSKGYDQHETHCTFAGLTASGESQWTTKAECSVEGDSQSFDWRLSLAGSRLTITDDAGSSEYERCP